MAWSQIAIGADGSIVGGAGNPTVTLNTTGADLIIIGCSIYSVSPAAGMFTDSPGGGGSQTWTLQDTEANVGDPNLVSGMLYLKNPTTNASHVFTFTPGGAFFGSMVVLAVSGLAAGAATSTKAQGVGTSLQPGSIGAANDLVASVISYYANNTMAIDSSFSTVTEESYVGSTHMGCALAYKSISGSTQPTWSWSGSNNAAAINIRFTGSGGGGGSNWGPMLGQQLNRIVKAE